MNEQIDFCQEASEMLKAAGFVVRYVSRSSEAVYYGMPGREGLLRVAAHAQNGRPRGAPVNVGKIVSRLTFSENIRPKSRDGFVALVANAVGWYVLRAGNKPVGLSVKSECVCGR